MYYAASLLFSLCVCPSICLFVLVLVAQYISPSSRVATPTTSLVFSLWYIVFDSGSGMGNDLPVPRDRILDSVQCTSKVNAYFQLKNG